MIENRILVDSVHSIETAALENSAHSVPWQYATSSPTVAKFEPIGIRAPLITL